MEDNENVSEETQLVPFEELELEEKQLVEQLYTSAGLDPVVDAGLKDYDKRLQTEDRFINKVFGLRGSDIKGYGDAVAKRVAFAVYNMLNRQYGGKVGDLRSYIMTLEDERDRANTRYDDLMGRVVGILGDEYKDLRTDSKEFMEKLTGVLGEDLKESRIDRQAIVESLADIDGLRSQIKTLETEKQQLKESYETQIATLNNEHKEEINKLNQEMAKLNSRIEGLESENTRITGELVQLNEDYSQLKTAITALPEAIPHEAIGKESGEKLYDFVLHDSRVPDKVIDGVGKFINFRKYLKLAATKGAEEATRQAKETLGKTMK